MMKVLGIEDDASLIVSFLADQSKGWEVLSAVDIGAMDRNRVVADEEGFVDHLLQLSGKIEKVGHRVR